MKYYEDDQVTLYCGDALEVLRTLPDESVHGCVTSPPYYRLRDYGVPGQYGLEPTPAAYVETMRAVFGEVRRVLAEDGTLWLNLGDTYSGSWGNQGRKQERGTQRPVNGEMLQPVHDGRYPDVGTRTGSVKPGAPPAKNLLGMPWRVAFALQDDGWILRNAVVWHKPNAMPESVTDRLSNRYEMVFLLARSSRYWFDLDAVRVPYADSTTAHAPRREFNRKDATAARFGNRQTGLDTQPHFHQERAGRNPGDCWEFPTQPFTAAHFACMPPALAERCVLAGCRPGGVVLDPFAGSGTTGMVALKHGRRFVGVDLSATYLDLALKTRLAQSALVDVEESAGATSGVPEEEVC